MAREDSNSHKLLDRMRGEIKESCRAFSDLSSHKSDSKHSVPYYSTLLHQSGSVKKRESTQRTLKLFCLIIVLHN